MRKNRDNRLSAIMSGNDLDVVIVGAGAAGLAALGELSRAGCKVLCLEARDRISSGGPRTRVAAFQD